MRPFEANVKGGLFSPKAYTDRMRPTTLTKPRTKADPRKPASSARHAYARKAPATISAHIESTYEIELSNRTGKARQPHDPEPSQSFDITVGVTLQGDGVR